MYLINDVLLNFNKELYEFYEWDYKDECIHLRQIPCIKVNNKIIREIYNNNIKFNKSLLEMIKDKTILFKNKQKINYYIIFYDEYIAIALELDEKGYIKRKSRMLYDEEKELLLNNKKQEKIKYNIIGKNNYNLNFYTRREKKLIAILNKYIESLEDDEKIKYIYLECTNKYENNSELCKVKLKKLISKPDINIIDKLINVIKVIKN